MNIKSSKKIEKNNLINRCRGPLSDLEKHLPNDWWKSIFNSYYLKTDADVVENECATKEEIDVFLNITQIGTSDTVLDLCCGQGRHSIELACRGYGSVQGIDRSRYLIRLARNRSQNLKHSIKFSEGDARKIRVPEQSFDCVMIMGNSYGYFEREDDDLKVLLEANRALREGGILYLDVTDGVWMKEHFEKRSWEWINQELIVCRERHLALDQQRLISRELISHAEKGVLTDQFYAERLYTFEELKSQLISAGFEKVEKHENLKGESYRNQDLGMMANRIIVTALSPKKLIKKKNKSQPKIDCTVLLGDPSLPDSVKRNGQFGHEDLETVSRMKKALENLKDFEFTYVDSHETLLNDFIQKKPEFVLNLCDEGWNNNPFMELHVPAFMEMLGIPYTGAGPDCLSVCYNKALVRSVAQDMEIFVPNEIWIDPSNNSAAIPSTFPAIIKPAFGDSSVGITQGAVVESAEDLVFYFDQLKTQMPNIPILIQEFLEGREFSVGLIGNGAATEILPVLEVDYSNLPKELPKILGYESKWFPDSPYSTQIRYHQAELDETALRYLIDASMNLFQRLGCRDYARFDFRMNLEGELKLLEVNPNPGWCWDGKMALMAEFAGISYDELLLKILRAGQERYSVRKN